MPGDAPWPWPFMHGGWKPAKPEDGLKGRIVDLVKAGALIAAEIDRLQRIRMRAEEEG